MELYTNDQIQHQIKEGVSYLQFKLFEPYQDILQHGITLRQGGVSKGIYASLNLRASSQDKRENVIQNMQKVCHVLDIDFHQLYKARQSHTDHILVLNQENKEAYSYLSFSDACYDGYVYGQSGIATAILTADCNPIILFDPVQKVVANVHSGWAGTIQKIYLKALQKMVQEFHCLPQNILVGVGPAIKKCCFSSEEESFKEKFTAIWENEEAYITYEEQTGNPSRFHIDLFYVIQQDLLKHGILPQHIAHMDICTKCHAQDFFSYRDSRKQGYSDYGNIACMAALR